MKKAGLLCLFLLLILPCVRSFAGYNEVIVAAKGSGVPVYAGASAGKRAGTLYNGYWDEVSLEDTNGRNEARLTADYSVWLDQEKAMALLPSGTGDTWQDRAPCSAFLAEVAKENAPQYGMPGKKHLSAKHAAGTLAVVWGEFGDYYYVKIPGAGEGFMLQSDLRRKQDLSFREAHEENFGLAVREAKLYTGGSPLYAAASATGYADQTSYWQMRDGYTVTVLAELGDYVQLRQGFVEKRFLDPDGDHSRNWATVTSDQPLNRLNIRLHPNTKASVEAKLCPGARVEVISRTEDWACVVVTGEAGGYRKVGCAQTKYLVFGDAGKDAASGFTRVRLKWDLISGNDGDSYRASWRNGEKTLAAGTEMTVVGAEPSYFDDDPDQLLVLLDDGTMACIWADGDLLTPVETLGVSVRTADSVRMRSAPEKNAKVLKTLSKGAKVEVLLRGERWTMIRYKEQTGYVMSRYLKFP